ncbi:MAG: adenylate/guanylate cyclase domain-containing protein [Aliidongia sp.]
MTRSGPAFACSNTAGVIRSFSAATCLPRAGVERALLFGDVRGFSKLKERQLQKFLDGVIGGFADVVHSYGDAVEYIETAGDGFYIVINDVAIAAECCFRLQAVLSPENVASLGLPGHLALRLGAHVGPVTPAVDRLIERRKYIGTEVTRTARIEPETPPGKTYVTEQFAATLYHADHCFRCSYVGIREMAKKYGRCRMYSLEARDL